jgi:ribosomal protein L7Ae-like RNA K-turn-binding protein
MQVRTEPAVLTKLIRHAAARRALSLLQAAHRARLAVLGAVPLEQVERDGRVELLVMANDARASAELAAVARLAASGRVRIFKSKGELGAAFGRTELALVGLLSAELAGEVSRMISVSELDEPGRQQRATEVG